ncbi:MAG: hypothetical protein E7638_01900 [Ruminococcaceae bacterium]|nr:hypothetical protein [Oscillospiraceae bacterium]
MVKKLLKHEFIYYIRTFILFIPIVLVLAAMTRVFWFFNDYDNIADDIAFTSSVALLIVVCAALLILSTVICIVRFYKNMFTSEGYLTFTLPITNAEHIFVKLFVGMVCQAVCFLTVVAAGCIAISGEKLVEVFDRIKDGVGELFAEAGVANSIGFIIEGSLLVILSLVSNMLLYYACITIGQTAKKNRILKAFGAYFIYYIATQSIVTGFMIVYVVLGMTHSLDGVLAWAEANSTLASHLRLSGRIVLNAVMGSVFWFVTQTIMTKKLNLE